MTPEEHFRSIAFFCEPNGKEDAIIDAFRVAMTDAKKQALEDAIATARNFNYSMVVTALRNKLAKLEESK
jgi:hypothetical protein